MAADVQIKYKIIPFKFIKIVRFIIRLWSITKVKDNISGYGLSKTFNASPLIIA